MYARIKDPAPSPTRERPNLPRDLERIVLRCLAREKSERFSDAHSLQKALSQCACAGEWTDELAAEWWEKEGGVGPAANSLVPTKEIDSTTVPLIG
jgi:serine/threonine-protein kinase